MALTSSVYDHLIILSSSVTLTFNQPEQVFQMHNYAKLYWNPCKNVEVMALTNSIYNHFIIWPSKVTLTFNLLERMFQMAILPIMEDNCAKWFWNPSINVEVMARTSSIYDHFLIWPSNVTLTFNLPEQIFQMTLLILKEGNYSKIFSNPCINVYVMARTGSIYDHYHHLTFKCDLDLQPIWTYVSTGTSTPQGEQLCHIILKSMHKSTSYGQDKVGWTYPQTHNACQFCGRNFFFLWLR